jgi:hypothetical protein
MRSARDRKRGSGIIWYKFVEHIALTEQRMHPLFRGVKLDMTVVTKSLARGAEQWQ